MPVFIREYKWRWNAFQLEAARLKSLDGTKVVAVGIGSSVTEAELSNIASPPHDRNIIHVQDFSTLRNVEDQLRYAGCTGWLFSWPLHTVARVKKNSAAWDKIFVDQWRMNYYWILSLSFMIHHCLFLHQIILPCRQLLSAKCTLHCACKHCGREWRPGMNRLQSRKGLWAKQSKAKQSEIRRGS